MRARRRISSCVVAFSGYEREAAQVLVHRARRIVQVALAHDGAQAQQLDALGGLGARARHARVDVEQAGPVLGALGQPLEVGQQLAARRVGVQRVAQDREGARRIVQLLLADERDLQRRRQLLDGLGGAGARALVDLDQILEQAVLLGDRVDQLQRLGVGVLVVRALVPLEGQARLGQLVLAQARDLEDQRAARRRILGLIEQLLVGEDQPLEVLVRSDRGAPARAAPRGCRGRSPARARRRRSPSWGRAGGRATARRARARAASARPGPRSGTAGARRP